jgi:addiction module HigA family antidote
MQVWRSKHSDCMSWRKRIAESRGARVSRVAREELMEPVGLSAYALAMALSVPLPRVNDIVREKRSISPEMAVLLSAYFGTSDGYWIDLQGHFYPEMVKKGWKAGVEDQPPPSRQERRAPVNLIQVGLPRAQLARLPKVGRSCGHDDVTAQFPCNIWLQRRLSAAVPREISWWYCPDHSCGVAFKSAQLQVGEKAWGGREFPPARRRPKASEPPRNQCPLDLLIVGAEPIVEFDFVSQTQC